MLRKLSEGLAEYLAAGEAAKRRRFVTLCRVWPQVVGNDLAALARPLGHRRREMVVGVEDPVVMQEMTFMVPQLLAAVNAALGSEAFDGIRLTLLGDKTPLDAPEAVMPFFSTPGEVAPERLGGLLGRLDPASPVARCYARYVAYFQAKPAKGAGQRGGRGKTTKRKSV